MTFLMTQSSCLMNCGSKESKSRWRELNDLIVFFMASVPDGVFGKLTKNNQWDTDATFLQ